MSPARGSILLRRPSQGGSIVRRTGIAGIILAAGEGRRIGRGKALLRIGGVTFLAGIVSALREAGCDPVCVVGGAEAEKVKEETLKAGAGFALNENWRKGQFSSLRVGLRDVERLRASCSRETENAVSRRSKPGADPGNGRSPKDCAPARAGTGLDPCLGSVVVSLVDHPLVSRDTYLVLVEKSGQFPGRILIPTHGGRRGHPVLLPREVVRDIVDGPEDSTLREVIRARSGLVVEVPVVDKGILQDFDTRADLKDARHEAGPETLQPEWEPEGAEADADAGDAEEP